MSNRSIIVLFSLISNSIFAQEFKWVVAEGSPGGGFGACVTTDEFNNVYVAGVFVDTLDFDPGPAECKLVSAGSGDIFIQKLDANGHLIWAKSFGGLASEIVSDIKVDNSGNIYLTGEFNNTCDFDPSPTATYSVTAMPGANSDGYILKLNSSGELSWVRQIGGKYEDYGNSIATDPFGNVYLAGGFRDTCDFNVGSGVHNLIASGWTDIFLLKLSSTGSFIWAKQFAATDDDCEFPTVIYSDDLYLAGNFSGSIDANPNSGVTTFTTNGQYDFFITKLYSNGVFAWAKQIGGPVGDECTDIALDPFKNIYISGLFKSTVDFDPGLGTFYATSTGGNDAFVLKLDNGGNFAWVDIFVGNSNDKAYSLTYTQDDHIVVTGYFNIQMDIDPGPPINLIPSEGSQDIFIIKLNSSGNLVWGGSIGSVNFDESFAICSDLESNLLLTGRYSGTTDFDPGGGTYFVTPSGMDIFTLKLGASINGVSSSIKYDNPLNLFPNPASKTVIIQGVQPLRTKTIKILNANGQEIFKETTNLNTEFYIDVSTYSPGIYFVLLQSEGSTWNQKLVISE